MEEAVYRFETGCQIFGRDARNTRMARDLGVG